MLPGERASLLQRGTELRGKRWCFDQNAMNMFLLIARLAQNRLAVAYHHGWCSCDSVEISRTLKISGRRRNTHESAQNRSESLRAGLLPDMLGLVWPSLRPKSGSKSKIAGRILKRCRGPFSSAELTCHTTLTGLDGALWYRMCPLRPAADTQPLVVQDWLTSFASTRGWP